MQTSLSQYERFCRLGSGGMAEVWLGVRKGPAGFRKLLVVKQLHEEYATDPMFVSMFLDEARLAAELSHPNIVQTLEFGGDDGNYFLVMEHLEGQTLRSIRSRLELPLPLELIIIRDILRALDYAHDLRGLTGFQLGIVHRDVSPDNVFVTYDGVTKLMDFGVAKATSARTRTRAGMFKGKATYMAPEQTGDEAVDRRADLFSVGAILWEALTRDRLWGTRSDIRILRELSQQWVPPLPESVKRSYPRLSEICERAMATDPAARFQSAAEFHDALDLYVKSEGFASEARDLGEAVGKAFAPERSRLRVTIEEQLMKLRAAGGRPWGPATQDLARHGTSPHATPSFPVDITGLRGVTLVPGRTRETYAAICADLGTAVTIDVYRHIKLGEALETLQDWAAIAHPTWTRALRVGAFESDGGGVFVVREAPRGRSLDALLPARTTLAPVDAVDLVWDLARGVALLHRYGHFHGAIGLDTVTVLGDHGRRSFKLAPPPLVARGPDELGRRTDVSALARMLYQLTCGRSPTSGEPPDPSMLTRAHRHPALATLLERCAGPDTFAWRDIDAFASELEHLDRTSLAACGDGDLRLPNSVQASTVAGPIPAARTLEEGGPPTVWVLSEDPYLRDPHVLAGLGDAERLGSLSMVDLDHAVDALRELRLGALRPPSVLVFGDADVERGHPLIDALRDVPDVSRLLVSASGTEEVLMRAANEVGLDRQLGRSNSRAEIVAAIEACIDRSRRVRGLSSQLQHSLARARHRARQEAVDQSSTSIYGDQEADIIPLRRTAMFGAA